MELIFIYNAGSGLFNYVTDFAHKIIAPSTYPCSLRAIAYGNLGMKKRWSEFIDSLPVKSVFLHKDELDGYDLPEVRFPAVMLKEADRFSIIADAQILNDLDALDDLITLLQSKLKTHLQPKQRKSFVDVRNKYA